jgi:hypothetical protein
LEVSSEVRTPAALPPGKKHPFDRRLVGPRTGLNDVENINFLKLSELGLLFLGDSAHSQSLYRLSYCGFSEYNFI